MARFKMFPNNRFSFSLIISSHGIGISIPFFMCICLWNTEHAVRYYNNYRITIQIFDTILILKNFIPNPIVDVESVDEITVLSRKRIHSLESLGRKVEWMVFEIKYYGIKFHYFADIYQDCTTLSIIRLPLVPIRDIPTIVVRADKKALFQTNYYLRYLNYLAQYNGYEMYNVKRTVKNLAVVQQLCDKLKNDNL